MDRHEKAPPRDPWFVYSRRAGKVSAIPVNGRGWLAFAACLVLTITVGWASSSWAATLHPVLGFLALGAVIVIGVLLIVRLAVAKGTPD